MVASIDITKMTVRGRVVVDLEVRMQDPDDHDFQPRAHLDGSTLIILESLTSRVWGIPIESP